MRRFVLLLSLAIISIKLGAQIVINELMQSNIDCIMDDRNDFPDSWVELYNSSSSPILLSGYHLSCKSSSQGYTLPATTISPHGYKIIYCDKVGEQWHTDFRLESGKGCLVRLLDGEGRVVDSVFISQKQPAPNIAYGRHLDGESTWGYQVVPTPGAPNCGTISSHLLPEPVFSMPGQVFPKAGSYSLTLSLPDSAPADAQIRYTLDGSEPTLASTLYSMPISINRTTIVRAKLFCQGWLSPRSTTASYIFHGRELTLPVLSIVTDSRYLYDPVKGIYTTGPDVDHPNYRNDWRRPISLELFEAPLQASVLSQLCETRIQGAASRSLQLKSLALYANKRFGNKRFSYEFFPDQRPGQTDFKSLLLRNAGNDFDYLYMRDAIIQRAMGEHADLDWQAWRPVIVYINGVYMGIENIRERSNEDNIYTNYGGLEDITLVENYWGELKCGSWQQWEDFRSFYSEHGHTFAELDSVYDTLEFINLMIMDLYFNNLDFPANNIAMWRPMAEGGRWRFIAKDTDFGLGLYNVPASYSTMHWLYTPGCDPDHDWGNASDGTRMFRRAMDNAEFRRMFVQRAAVYIGDFLHFDAVWPMWEQMYLQICDEYPIHRALYNRWWPNYQDELQWAKDWLRNRPAYFLNQLRAQYGLGQLLPLTINESLTDSQLADMQLHLCDVPIRSARWTGHFFAGEIIRLELDYATAQTLSWRVRVYTDANQYTELHFPAHTDLTLPQSAFKVEITAVPDYVEGNLMSSVVEPATRQIHDGRLLIRRGNSCYDVLGRVVR